MRKTKFVTLLLLALMLISALAACGGKGSAAKPVDFEDKEVTAEFGEEFSYENLLTVKDDKDEIHLVAVVVKTKSGGSVDTFFNKFYANDLGGYVIICSVKIGGVNYSRKVTVNVQRPPLGTPLISIGHAPTGYLNVLYNLPVATAMDTHETILTPVYELYYLDGDEDITDKITPEHTFTPTEKGEYKLVVRVEDSAGNKKSVERIFIIRNPKAANVIEDFDLESSVSVITNKLVGLTAADGIYHDTWTPGESGDADEREGVVEVRSELNQYGPHLFTSFPMTEAELRAVTLDYLCVKVYIKYDGADKATKTTGLIQNKNYSIGTYALNEWIEIKINVAECIASKAGVWTWDNFYTSLTGAYGEVLFWVAEDAANISEYTFFVDEIGFGILDLIVSFSEASSGFKDEKYILPTAKVNAPYDGGLTYELYSLEWNEQTQSNDEIKIIDWNKSEHTFIPSAEGEYKLYATATDTLRGQDTAEITFEIFDRGDEKAPGVIENFSHPSTVAVITNKVNEVTDRNVMHHESWGEDENEREGIVEVSTELSAWGEYLFAKFPMTKADILAEDFDYIYIDIFIKYTGGGAQSGLLVNGGYEFGNYDFNTWERVKIDLAGSIANNGTWTSKEDFANKMTSADGGQLFFIWDDPNTGTNKQDLYTFYIDEIGFGKDALEISFGKATFGVVNSPYALPQAKTNKAYDGEITYELYFLDGEFPDDDIADMIEEDHTFTPDESGEYKLVASIGAITAAITFTILDSDEDILNSIVDFVMDVETGRNVKVLQLSDIQIIDGDQPPDSSYDWLKEDGKCSIDKIGDLAFKYIIQSIETVKPDLIVLTGDNIYGRFDNNGSVFAMFIEFMDSFEIPWAPVYGNHDNESAKGVVWQNQQLIDSEYCLFEKGTATGNGNYTVGITQGNKLTQVIYLMDSHGIEAQYADAGNGVVSERGFRADQIDWFVDTQRSLKAYNGNVNVNSIGFTHHSHQAMEDSLEKYGLDFATLGRNGKGEIPSNSNGDFGKIGEAIFEVDNIDTDYTMHNLSKTYGTQGWFFGHYHLNNASVINDGVRYTFGLKSSEYDAFDEELLGGTLITLGESLFDVEHIYYKDLTFEEAPEGFVNTSYSLPVATANFSHSGEIEYKLYKIGTEGEITILEGNTFTPTVKGEYKLVATVTVPELGDISTSITFIIRVPRAANVIEDFEDPSGVSVITNKAQGVTTNDAEYYDSWGDGENERSGVVKTDTTLDAYGPYLFVKFPMTKAALKEIDLDYIYINMYMKYTGSDKTEVTLLNKNLSLGTYKLNEWVRVEINVAACIASGDGLWTSLDNFYNTMTSANGDQILRVAGDNANRAKYTFYIDEIGYGKEELKLSFGEAPTGYVNEVYNLPEAIANIEYEGKIEYNLYEVTRNGNETNESLIESWDKVGHKFTPDTAGEYKLRAQAGEAEAEVTIYIREPKADGVIEDFAVPGSVSVITNKANKSANETGVDEQYHSSWGGKAGVIEARSTYETSWAAYLFAKLPITEQEFEELDFDYIYVDVFIKLGDGIVEKQVELYNGDAKLCGGTVAVNEWITVKIYLSDIAKNADNDWDGLTTADFYSKLTSGNGGALFYVYDSGDYTFYVDEIGYGKDPA